MVPTAVERSPRTMEMSCRQLFPKGSRTLPRHSGTSQPAAKELPWIGSGLEPSREPSQPASPTAVRRICIRCPRTRAAETRLAQTWKKRSRRCPSDKKQNDGPLCLALCPADCARVGGAWLSFWTYFSTLPSFTRRNSSSSCVFRSVHTALESACRTSFWNDYGAALQTLHLRPNTSSAGFQSHSSKLAVDTSCLDSCSLCSTVRWTPNWLF